MRFVPHSVRWEEKEYALHDPGPSETTQEVEGKEPDPFDRKKGGD
jgi:hypothetical protein